MGLPLVICLNYELKNASTLQYNKLGMATQPKISVRSLWY
jgi:hypothetical protein